MGRWFVLFSLLLWACSNPQKPPEASLGNEAGVGDGGMDGGLRSFDGGQDGVVDSATPSPDGGETPFSDGGDEPSACFLPEGVDQSAYDHNLIRFRPDPTGPCRVVDQALEGACPAHCTVRTRRKLLRCTTSNCVDEALTDDPTRVEVLFPPDFVFPSSDCSDCFRIQSDACFDLACRAQWDEYLSCSRRENPPPPCRRQERAVQKCLRSPHLNGYRACLEIRRDAFCFGTPYPVGFYPQERQ